MTATDKPTVYIFGKKKDGAQQEPTLTKEMYEKIKENVRKYSEKK